MSSLPLTFHPRPLIYGLPDTYLSIFFSEFTGLFELKFHMEDSVDKTIYIYIILRSLDQSGHCPYMVKQNMFE